MTSELLVKLKALQAMIEEIIAGIPETAPNPEFEPVITDIETVPDSILENNPNNPADTEEKRKKLEEAYDYVSEAGQGWNLKKDEGMEHLRWRAEKKGDEPEFIE